ncbi:O-antigen ligase family protein [Leptospira levettii]|uniref:O-antigen ligase family protein n=1 Tax=Leptospira levettii TaxID=2023178 RepID=UPI00223DB1A3|nr:O-antigen ligase family protein [Leptospira levettii]MCW7509233.1 O-antigen ligase family protein [Leptospira levettii]MCW7520322.1 O-antigen ligase family protein [Leptospira levettii]
MKRFYPFVIDFVILVGISILFQTYTNQKNFKLDIIGLGIFSFLVYSIYRWRVFVKDPLHFWNLLHVILLTCFVFLKIAEYDPIQIFPQKLGIKLVTLIWLLFILISFHKLSVKQFQNLGPFLAMVPVLSFIDFMAYPSVPIAIALLLTLRNSDLPTKEIKPLYLFALIILFLIIGRDWWDDFALQRGVLILEAFLFFQIIRNWEKNDLILFLKSCIFFYIINSIFIYFALYLDPKFQITSYRENVYLIPVSLLASNSLLMIMMSVLFWFEPTQNKSEKIFLLIAFLVSVIWFGITVSRNSIGSLFVFLFFVLYIRQDQTKKKNLLYGFITIVAAIGFAFLFFTEKSIFNLGSTAVRLSIWGFYIINTLQENPFFGFGLYPENKIPFDSAFNLKSESLHYIKDYIINFDSFPLAHNLYVQFFGSFGILGLFLVLGLFFYCLIQKRINLANVFKNNQLVSIVLFVWMLHELYDFNSLEISNLFVLVGISAILILKKQDVLVEKQNQISGKRFSFIVIAIFLIIVSFRFSYVDHFTLKFARKVIPHNFEFYLPRKDSVAKFNQSMPEFSLTDYFFFGNKFFFYNLAAKDDLESNLKHLNYCFELQNYPAICYSKLIQFQSKENYFPTLIPLFQYFLNLHDPFGIYQREQL